ncbi:MAG: hypothetical protein LUC33_00875 [Prevotellaceae bacterium]|nr:hypothetical protein [Prevotellaceae bacterium]
MKKNLVRLSMLLAAVTVSFAFASCSDDDDDSSSKYSIVGTWETSFSSTNEIFDFVFNEDGSGYATYKHGSTTKTRRFKYTINDTDSNTSYDWSTGSTQLTYVYSITFKWTQVDSSYRSDSDYDNVGWLFTSKDWDEIQVYDYPSTNNIYMWWYGYTFTRQ